MIIKQRDGDLYSIMSPCSAHLTALALYILADEEGKWKYNNEHRPTSVRISDRIFLPVFDLRTYVADWQDQIPCYEVTIFGGMPVKVGSNSIIIRV